MDKIHDPKHHVRAENQRKEPVLRAKTVRIGRHHFAHLRAVANGIPADEAALRYLGVTHGHEGPTLHRQAVDLVRSIARRKGDSAWRLIGLTIRIPSGQDRPSLEQFIQERGLDGFSEAEVSEMYQDAYPADKRAQKRNRLMERQLRLLKDLENIAAETPKPTDMVEGWFDPLIAAKLIGAGMLTLGDLQKKIQLGGRWFDGLPGIGKTKADRIKKHLSTLLPPARTVTVTSRFEVALRAIESPAPSFVDPHLAATRRRETALRATTDAEAVDAWIRASATTKPTEKVYKREARRLALWMLSRNLRSFAELKAEDAMDYMAFLQDIPDEWISRTKASPGQPGWAPFRGKLSLSSQRQSVAIISGLYAWLHRAGWISVDPWLLANKDTGDDREQELLDSKAFSDGAMSQILTYIEAADPSPARARIEFIFRFVESTGLRSSELINLRLENFRREPEGWVMQVFGKGSRNRLVAVPKQGFNALQAYLQARGLGGIESAPGKTPVLASAVDPMEPISYPALYQTVKSWVSRAINASDLSSTEREKFSQASTHWLRHTFGTKAMAKGVPVDVIQAQMGHSSQAVTTAIYSRAPLKRRAEELEKAFG